LIFPDLRDHYLIGETTNFFAGKSSYHWQEWDWVDLYKIIEHILILLAPAYMIYSGRYLVLPTSKNMALLSFFVYSFFHSPVLHLCALRWNQNLNYLFSPPPSKLNIYIKVCILLTLFFFFYSQISFTIGKRLSSCIIQHCFGRNVCNKICLCSSHMLPSS
jgi:hypothetical protein